MELHGKNPSHKVFNPNLKLPYKCRSLVYEGAVRGLPFQKGPERDSSAHGVTQPYLHIKARYSAETIFCRLFMRHQVPLLNLNRRNDWLDFPSTNWAGMSWAPSLKGCWLISVMTEAAPSFLTRDSVLSWGCRCALERQGQILCCFSGEGEPTSTESRKNLLPWTEAWPSMVLPLWTGILFSAWAPEEGRLW